MLRIADHEYHGRDDGGMMISADGDDNNASGMIDL